MTETKSLLLPERLEYDPMGAKIWAYIADRKFLFADIRGFGFLIGGGAMALSEKDAEKIQDNWGKIVCDLFNHAQKQSEMDKDYTHPENMYKNQEKLDTSETTLSPAHLAALGMMANLE